MIKRTTATLAAGLAIALMLGSCQTQTPLPLPISDEDRTAIASGRPTLPPTFTPSATWTPTRTTTPDEAESPTPTVSLTPTSAVLATRTRIPPATATPTWTPDTDIIIPTSGPSVGGNTATPFPGFTPGSAGTMTPTVAAGTTCGSGTAQTLLQNGGFEGPIYRERYSQVDAPESWTGDQYELRPGGLTFTAYTGSAGCDWAGMAGLVFDKDGNHQLGVRIHIFDDNDSFFRNSGTETNPYGESGWEQRIDDEPVDERWYVQVVDGSGNALSDRITVNMKDDCAQNLAIVSFDEQDD